MPRRARLHSLREQRPLFVLVSSVTLAVLLAWPLFDYWLRLAGIAPQFRFWDFGVYGGTVNRWLEGGPLYVRNDSGGYHGSYLYPPLGVLLFAPFVEAFPSSYAAVAWEVFSVGALWVGLQLVCAAVGFEVRGGERLVLLWATLGFQPLLFGVKMGQTPALLTALLCVAFAAPVLAGRRWGDRVAGVATAVVGTLKLVYAPSGAFLLRRRRRLAWAVATGLGLVALSVAVFGVETHRAYLGVLRWGIETGGESRSPRLWMVAYYRPLYAVPGKTLLRVAAGLGIAALAVLATGDADREAFAAGVAAIPLLAPQTYTYYLVALLPAAVVLLAVELDHADGRPTLVPVGVLLAHAHSYGLGALAVVVPAWIPPSPAFAPVLALIQPGLWGNLLLVTLATRRLAERVEWGGVGSALPTV